RGKGGATRIPRPPLERTAATPDLTRQCDLAAVVPSGARHPHGAIGGDPGHRRRRRDGTGAGLPILVESPADRFLGGGNSAGVVAAGIDVAENQESRGPARGGR